VDYGLRYPGDSNPTEATSCSPTRWVISFSSTILLAALLSVTVAGCASAPVSNGSNTLHDFVNDFTRKMGNQVGTRFSGVELVPFESKIPGTMKWKAAQVGGAGRRLVTFDTFIFAEFPKGSVMQLEVHAGRLHGAGAADEVARGMLATLVARPGDAECVWPVYRAMIRAIGSDPTETERSTRAKATASGEPQALWFISELVTVIFNFDERGVCYTYRLPGSWSGTNVPMLFQSAGVEAAGVWFYRQDLR